MGGDSGGNMASGAYTPESPLNGLNAEGQNAFCQSSITRNEEAALEGEQLDQFISNSCLLFGIVNSTDEASCTESIATCEMDLRSLMVTSEQCLADRVEQFASCAASVSDIETCEDAIRDRAYESILNFNFTKPLSSDQYDCSSAGNQLELIALGGMASALVMFPTECSAAAQECISINE